MKRFCTLLALGLVAFAATDATAQNRDIGAQRVIIDNGPGNTLTIEYTGTGNQTYTFTAGGSATPAGTLAGQMLRWDGANWVLSNALLNDGTDLTFGGTLTGNGSLLTSLNASSLASGTVADARLSSTVTLAGNTFNGANQLLQLNGTSDVPDANLSANVPLLNANNVFTGNFTLNPPTGSAGFTMTPTNTILSGRDVIGADYPLIIAGDVTGQTFGVNTHGRLLRFEQTDGVGHFYDVGIDDPGNLFISNYSSTSKAIQVNIGGGVAIPTGNFDVTAGNITLSGTVDGVDLSTADAANVKLSGNQTIAGTKTFSSPIAGSVTGTAANVTGIVAAANGGTGVDASSTAINLVFASPTGAAGVPTFRALATSDIPAAMATDAEVASTYLPLAGGTMSGALNMGTQSITDASGLSFNDGAARSISIAGNAVAGDALNINAGAGAAGAGGAVNITGGDGSTTDGAVNISTTLGGATNIGHALGGNVSIASGDLFSVSSPNSISINTDGEINNGGGDVTINDDVNLGASTGDDVKVDGVFDVNTAGALFGDGSDIAQITVGGSATSDLTAVDYDVAVTGDVSASGSLSTDNLAGAGANRFAHRVLFSTLVADPDANVATFDFTVPNTNVTASSVIIVSFETTGTIRFASVRSRIAATSFIVEVSGAPVAGDALNYMIINP